MEWIVGRTPASRSPGEGFRGRGLARAISTAAPASRRLPRDFVGAGLPALYPLQRGQAGAYVFRPRHAAPHPRDFVGAGLPALHPIIRVNSVYVRNAIAVMLANVGGKLLLQG